MAKFAAGLVAIAACVVAFALPSASRAAAEGLSCIDARPDGALVKKQIVFEKNGGVRSPDAFVLLKKWNSAAGAIDALDHAQMISIDISDWTVLNVERVQANPNAQTAMPTLISATPVDMTVDPAQIVIADGLIALTPQGCDDRQSDQTNETVFFGKITFGSSNWHVVGQYSIFARPSWNAGPSRKPGP